MEKKARNIFALLSLVFIITFFVILLGVDITNDFVYLIFPVLVVVSLIFSILGIIKSNKLKKEIGKRKGIFISIFTFLISGILFLSFISTVYLDNKFIGDLAEKEAIQEVEYGIKQILKNPQSLQIHNVKLKCYCFEDENGNIKFCNTQEELKNKIGNIDKYIIFYNIDYSAQNGYGGMNRQYINVQITVQRDGNSVKYSDLKESLI